MNSHCKSVIILAFLTTYLFLVVAFNFCLRLNDFLNGSTQYCDGCILIYNDIITSHRQ